MNALGIIQTLNQVQRNILLLVQLSPDVCDNYNLLCARYWTNFDNINTIQGIENATPSETITRAYRLLVSEGVVKQITRSNYRKKLEGEYRTTLGSKSPKYLRC